MKQQPKSRKFLKPHLPKLRKNFSYQEVQTQAPVVFALIAKEPRSLSFSQIEAARRAIVRTIKKTPSRFAIRISPTHPKTKIPLETRMGGGKRAVDSWVAVVQKRTILFELSRIPTRLVHLAFNRACSKLSGSYSIEQRLRPKNLQP